MLLVSYLRIHCQIQGHQDFILWFLIRLLWCLALIFRSLIHFELVLYEVMNQGKMSFSCMWHPVVPAKRLVLLTALAKACGCRGILAVTSHPPGVYCCLYLSGHLPTLGVYCCPSESQFPQVSLGQLCLVYLHPPLHPLNQLRRFPTGNESPELLDPMQRKLLY